MHLLITGSSGLIGSAVVPALGADGHQVTRLVRRRPQAGAREIPWDPTSIRLDPHLLDGVDGVIHLAGEPIVGRWTAARRRRLVESRVGTTHVLARAISESPRPPLVMIVASATGYYGDHGASREDLTEESPPGTGFLADLTRQWEAAAEPASRRGVRVVHLRNGIVLSGRGGALARMLPVYRFGLGGPLGDGSQFWSWISIDDVVGVVRYALTTSGLAGPVNVTTPTPVTNRQFSDTLARVLHRPGRFPVPRIALELLFGRSAAGAVLAGCRAIPKHLVASGFRFQFPEIESALRHLTGRRDTR